NLYGGLLIEGKWADYLIDVLGRCVAYQYGHPVGSFCIFLTHSADREYPAIDTLIAWYLLLHNDEFGFWRIGVLSAIGEPIRNIRYLQRAELDQLEREVTRWRADSNSAPVVTVF